MNAFPSGPNLNDEHLKGTTRFKWDGAKWKRLGQNFDTATIAQEVAASIGGGGGDVSSVNGMTGDVRVLQVAGEVFDVKKDTPSGGYAGATDFRIKTNDATSQSGATLSANESPSISMLNGVGYKWDISDSNLAGATFYFSTSKYPHYSYDTLGPDDGFYTYGEIGTTGAYIFVQKQARHPIDTNGWDGQPLPTYARRYYMTFTGTNSSPYRKQISFIDSDFNSIQNNIPETIYKTITVTPSYTGSFPYGATWYYQMDGVTQDTLTLFRGMAYKFDLSNYLNSIVMEKNFRIWSTGMSVSATSTDLYTDGFTKYGTEGTDGYAIFKVPHDAPNTLWYGGNNFYYYTNQQLKTMGATLDIQTITGQ